MQKRPKKGFKSEILKVSFLLFFLDVFCQYYFRLTHVGVENYGFSFGIGVDLGAFLPVAIFGVFLGWCLLMCFKQRGISRWMIVLLLGSLGNLISRLIWGSVWDYICTPLLPFCFNVSDVLISFGLISYILGGDEDLCSL